MTADRLPVRVLLAGRTHDYVGLSRPLLRALELTHHFELQVTTDAGSLGLDGAGLAMAASDVALSPGEALRLSEFVRAGGGLVVLHGTLAAWSGQEPIAEMAGWAPVGPAPLTELILQADPSHPVTARLGPELRFVDELYLSEGPPADAATLLTTTWRFTEQVVAYERSYGTGRFIHVGLGHAPEAYEDPTFHKLLHRCLLFAAGRGVPEPMGVGLLGYGAIARAHAGSIASVAGLRLSGVCDIAADRRELAAREWRVRVHASPDDLLDDPDVGLVVVGTPPVAHADTVVNALAAGKHVVCEKPFALRVDEVDRMIDEAASRDRVLTVYQSRRWDPDFVALREVVRSGRIGDPFYMESFIGGHSHPCSFWHSHEPVSGGTIYDWGSHYFDWILQLFDARVRTISAQAHKLVWHDVTNADQVRVDLTFADGAQAIFLQSDIAAAAKPKWYVLATCGAVVGDWRDEPVPADFPALLSVMRPAEGGGAHREALVLPPRDEHAFYRNLADHLAWDEALAVTPEEARRTVAVMEVATQSIALGGAQVEVNI